MKILSLFDGISCARVALEKAGIKVDKYYSSEIDKYAIQVSKKNYPDIIQLGDVREVSLKKFPEINRPDLMILGSPCQDLSIAKKNREGLDGKRSGLFWEAIRIHREVRPVWFVYENVNSMKQEWKDQMLKAVQKIEPLAYMIMINAALVSAQNRKRIFITNIPCIQQPKDREVFLKDILEPKVGDEFMVKLKSNTVRSSGRGSGIDDKHNWDTIRIGQIGKGGQSNRIYSPERKSVGLSALGGGRGAKTGLYAVENKSYCVPATYYKENVKSLVQRKKKGLLITQKSAEADIASNCKNINSISENYIVRKLTAVECERLQSLPSRFTELGINEKGEEVKISNSQRYRMLGNAFNAEVVAHILSFIK